MQWKWETVVEIEISLDQCNSPSHLDLLSLPRDLGLLPHTVLGLSALNDASNALDMFDTQVGSLSRTCTPTFAMLRTRIADGD